jgi:hypothetical protein
MTKVILLISLMFLGSCSWFIDVATPVVMGGSPKVPEGTPVFKRGWQDGCSTVTYARGNFLYKFLYKHRYDTKMIGNPEYRFGYSRGYSVCFHVILGGGSAPQSSFDRYILPYGNNSVIDMSIKPNALNNAWHGFFGDASGIWKGDLTNSNVTLESVMDVWQKSENGGGTVFGGHPLWAGGSKGQIFGQ